MSEFIEKPLTLVERLCLYLGLAYMCACILWVTGWLLFRLLSWVFG